MNILVTGATGFVGQSLIANLAAREGLSVRGTVRNENQRADDPENRIAVGEIDGSTSWGDALDGIDVIVHTAARAHVMREDVANSLAAYRRTNVDGTMNLAQQAVAAGVKRFLFLSSIKVNGESTGKGLPFSALDEPHPEDPYGISKFEAEQGLRGICSSCDMEWVIIRPPLVYGPGVKANFLNMMRWLKRGAPLPFSLTTNKRSFVALDNLVDLIATCIEAPAAANRLFLVSDGHDLSTAELLRIMGDALGCPARLLPCPIWLLRVLATLVGKPTIAQRLLDSLQVDMSETATVLDWTPPLNVNQAMKKTADHFLQQPGAQ